jgi:protein KIBRA
VSSTQEKPVDMDDLHRRVERLLRGETPSGCGVIGAREFSSVSGGGSSLAGLLYSGNMSQGSGLGRPGTPPISPLSEKMAPLPTPPSTRSVSAAVSDESVAGDSGVFEAANKSSSHHSTVPDANSETAQIQIKLR